MLRSDTTAKGNVGQAAVTLDALKRGYIVSVPSEGASYDLIIDRGSSLDRVQVKYCTPTKGILKIPVDVRATTSTGFYHSGNVDAMAIYDPTTNKTYWIPSDVLHGTVMTIRTEPTKNNQSHGIRWASDFEVW
jgi:hypothetical protein